MCVYVRMRTLMCIRMCPCMCMYVYAYMYVYVYVYVYVNVYVYVCVRADAGSAAAPRSAQSWGAASQSVGKEVESSVWLSRQSARLGTCVSGKVAKHVSDCPSDSQQHQVSDDPPSLWAAQHWHAK